MRTDKAVAGAAVREGGRASRATETVVVVQERRLARVLLDFFMASQDMQLLYSHAVRFIISKPWLHSRCVFLIVCSTSAVLDAYIL